MDNRSLEGNSPDPQLNVYLQRYGEWLSDAQAESDKVRYFRMNWPARFQGLCKFHLSILIDVPVEFVNEYKWQSTTAIQETTPSNNGTDELMRQSSSISLTASSFAQRQCKQTTTWQRIRNAAFGSGPLSSQISSSSLKYSDDMTWQNISTLMDVVDNKEYLSREGIFRKTGNLARQRIIRQRIISGKPIDLTNVNPVEPRPWLPAGKSMSKKVTPLANSTVTAHDLASALKGALFDLTEPVLTTTLIPLFRQVAGLSHGRPDENGQRVSLRPVEEKIAIGKQMKALRLLCLMLPEKQCTLFQRLLRLLHNALRYTDTNRLSTDTLGTLFTPLLLSPKHAPTRDLDTQYNDLAHLTSIMISQGVEGLWKIPNSLVQDIEKGLGRVREVTKSVLNLNGADATQLINCTNTAGEGAHPMTRSISHDSGIGWTDGSQPSSDGDSGLLSNPTFRGIQFSKTIFTPRTITRKQRYRFKVSFYNNEEDELNPALVTCVKFVSSTASLNTVQDSGTVLGETECAVAELYASIQALPDEDPRKSRLVQRFNASNGLAHSNYSLDSSQESRTDGTISATGSRGDVTLMRCVTQPLSPVNGSQLVRAGCITGGSAARAARNIRSSLRRRLALRSNLSVSSGLKYTDFSVELPIPEVSTKAASNNAESENIESTAVEAEIPDNINDRIMSPTFGDLPESIGYDGANTESCEPLNVLPRSRLSVISSSSIAGKGSGEWFCCPFVEVLSSPFKRRLLYSRINSTSLLSHTDTATPIKRAVALKRKRAPCATPQLEQARLVSSTYSNSLPSVEIADSRTYLPVFVADEHLAVSQVKTDVNHDRAYKQKEITAFGYRTIGNKAKRLSASGHFVSKSYGSGLRRVRTMPDLKISINPLCQSFELTDLHESLLG